MAPSSVRQACLSLTGIGITVSVLLGVNHWGNPATLHSLAVAETRQAEAQERERRALADRFGTDVSPLPTLSYAKGKGYFEQSCAACHGYDGRGVAALGGKDLVASDFVTGTNDAELIAFIAQGREPGDPQNTTRMLMPPKGGNADLGDAQLAEIVSYLRGLQDPRRQPAGPLPKVVLLGDEPIAAPAPAVASGSATGASVEIASAEAAAPLPAVALDPEAVKRGKRAYMSCIACHGKDGTGVKGVGKDLVHSPFVTGTSDADLVAFIKVGRGPSDAGNTTGIAMPPKGGNPALKDEQIKDIVTYIRSLHQAAAKADATN